MSICHYLAEEPASETGLTLSVYAGDEEEPIWTWSHEPVDLEAPDDEEPGPNDPPDTRILSAQAGLNRRPRDLRFPGMERFADLIMWADMREGPMVVPGTYRAALQLGEAAPRVVEFEVLPDPGPDRPRPTIPRSSNS